MISRLLFYETDILDVVTNHVYVGFMLAVINVISEWI